MTDFSTEFTAQRDSIIPVETISKKSLPTGPVYVSSAKSQRRDSDMSERSGSFGFIPEEDLDSVDNLTSIFDDDTATSGKKLKELPEDLKKQSRLRPDHRPKPKFEMVRVHTRLDTR